MRKMEREKRTRARGEREGGRDGAPCGSVLRDDVLVVHGELLPAGDVRRAHVGAHARTHVAQPRRPRGPLQIWNDPGSEKILPVVKNQHLLLCTLLIGNSLAMEALPLCLDALVPSWGAVLISVTLILAFGEIMPQAVCSRYGLRVGAMLAGAVRVLLMVFFPVAYPISKLLDWILGKGHIALLRRSELKTLVDMHGNEAGKGGELTHDETTIITGALDLTQKTAKDAMTTMADTFSLNINSKLDMETLSLIMTKGHSRVPVYSGSPKNIIGIILVKNLIACRPEDEVPIRNFTIRKIPRLYDDLPLYDILNEFEKGHSHMAVVVKRTFPLGSPSRNGVVLTSHLDKQGTFSVKTESVGFDTIVDARLGSILSLPAEVEEVIGIITMEDVLEELLQEEIFDETDEYVDVHNKITVNMLPRKKSSQKSPSSPFLQRQIPTAPPFSPNRPISVLRSPLRSPLAPCTRLPGNQPKIDSHVSS